MARPRGFPRQSRSRRATSWGLGPITTPVTATVSGSALWTAGVSSVEGILTLIRTRGVVDVYLHTTAGGTTDGFRGAVGIGIVSSAAFAAGVASVPTPLSEEGWDGWLWHHYFNLHGGPDAPGSHVRMVIDSKAMRKFDSLDTIYGCTEQTETGVEVMTTVAQSRMLFKV